MIDIIPPYLQKEFRAGLLKKLREIIAEVKFKLVRSHFIFSAVINSQISVLKYKWIYL